MTGRPTQIVALLTTVATGRDRAAVFPYAMFLLSSVVFVTLFIGMNFAWPEFMSTAQSGTSNPDALAVIDWYDLLIFPISPFIFTALSVVYVNVRANRDAGRV